jgi:hypothetical protein
MGIGMGMMMAGINNIGGRKMPNRGSMLLKALLLPPFSS